MRQFRSYPFDVCDRTCHASKHKMVKLHDKVIIGNRLFISKSINFDLSYQFSINGLPFPRLS